MIFTFITFPFFFGLMFGDIGHGIILLLVGIYLNQSQKYQKKTKSFAYSFSYVIISSAIFSIFAGIVYDEIFSRPFLATFSGYKIYENSKPRSYPFGISPKW